MHRLKFTKRAFILFVMVRDLVEIDQNGMCLANVSVLCINEVVRIIYLCFIFNICMLLELFLSNVRSIVCFVAYE